MTGTRIASRLQGEVKRGLQPVEVRFMPESRLGGTFQVRTFERHKVAHDLVSRVKVTQYCDMTPRCSLNTYLLDLFINM
jgi:hypothetical protein